MRTFPQRVAEDVHLLSFGLFRGNVYFVGSKERWALIDTGVAGVAARILDAARTLFGDTGPAAILLTHVHPDHSGSALELAQHWGCRVHAHPTELPLAIDRRLVTIERFANPMDRWVIVPILRLLPARSLARMLEAGSLAEVMHALPVDGSVPGLPGWRSIPTPGHTPGHVAFFRAADRVLVAGDAVLTVDAASPLALLAWALGSRRPRVAAPAWYTNWNPTQARASIALLAQLEPSVLATGHGLPLAEAAAALHAFASR